MLVSEQIPKEDLDYILEQFKEDKEEDNKKIISEKIIAVIRDAKGNIIDKREQKMKSLTQYYLALMSIAILGTYSGSTGANASPILKNVLGLPNNQSTNNNNTVIISFDTSIQLGSGTQSFSPTLKGLNAPISNGSGTGQLYYYTQNVSYNNNSISQILTVSNISGNTVNVNEIGLLGTIYITYTQVATGVLISTYNYLLSYDTFSSPISIPNYGSASFQIIITFSG